MGLNSQRPPDIEDGLLTRRGLYNVRLRAMTRGSGKNLVSEVGLKKICYRAEFIAQNTNEIRFLRGCRIVPLSVDELAMLPQKSIASTKWHAKDWTWVAYMKNGKSEQMLMAEGVQFILKVLNEAPNKKLRRKELIGNVSKKFGITKGYQPEKILKCWEGKWLMKTGVIIHQKEGKRSSYRLAGPPKGFLKKI